MPVQPFVECYIEGVPVRALLDTGSMKSFINTKIHAIIDFQGSLLDRSKGERCISITGGDLHVLGQIVGRVKFAQRRHNYEGSFLVSSNIRYDCVLGWDFMTQNKLSLHGDSREGRSSYQLVGIHGKTPIQSEHPAESVQLNGVVSTDVNLLIPPSKNDCSEGTVLVQSQLKGVKKIILGDGVAIHGQNGNDC